jgi:hypothetical protein
MDPSILQQFSWEDVAKEAKMHTPILYGLLKTLISKEDKEYYDNVPHSHALPSSLEKHELTSKIGIVSSLCWALF